MTFRKAQFSRLVGALVLIVAANLFALTFVLAERFIYTWDFALYWNKFAGFGNLARTDASSALTALIQSMAIDDYTLVPVVPLAPFEWVFGPGRLSYILAITNVSLVPAAILLALVAVRALGKQSAVRVFLSAAAILTLHVLWAPALRGLPDVLGLAIAATVLLLYFRVPPTERSWFALAGIGALLCLLILTRRWYIFWAMSFFPAAIVAHLASGEKRPRWADTFATGKALAVIGVTCAACLLMFAAPVVLHAFDRSYSSAYAAYRSDLAGGVVTQVIGHFGTGLLLLCIGGMAWLAARKETRGFGLFLIVQTAVAFIIFTQVQSFLGLHHYYLLLPAAAIGLAAAINGIWDSGLRLHWRVAATSGALSISLLSSMAAFSPTRIGGAPLLPSARFEPLVRDDLPELDHLFETLSAANPDRVYVVASSQLLNWGTFKMGCRQKHPELCPRIAVSHDVDARDGFPTGMLDADYLVLGTPNQYHLLPQDQQVIGRVADAVRQGRGIGASFRKIGGSFQLADGIQAEIYRRVRPLDQAAILALSDDLAGQYPGQEKLFRPPFH